MNEKTIIICDGGINHNGNIHLAHELTRQAAGAGADFIKWQAYDVDALFGPHGADPNPEIYAGVKPLEFNEEQFAQLKEWADQESIGFMCSTFDETRLNWIEKLGVKYHKIASRVSKLDRPLAEKTLKIGKPTFVSLGFGAKGFDPSIKNAYYLYCVSSYPTEYKELELPAEFAKTPKHYYGISDHTLGIGASLAACGRGARVIEKHFTLDKSARGFDHLCSCTPEELRDLVKYTREIDIVLRNSGCK
jgi:N,N'-diacetyllegionaminate synthase